MAYAEGALRRQRDLRTVMPATSRSTTTPPPSWTAPPSAMSANDGIRLHAYTTGTTGQLTSATARSATTTRTASTLRTPTALTRSEISDSFLITNGGSSACLAGHDHHPEQQHLHRQQRLGADINAEEVTVLTLGAEQRLGQRPERRSPQRHHRRERDTDSQPHFPLPAR